MMPQVILTFPGVITVAGSVPVSNPIPNALARAVPDNIPLEMLGRPGTSQVFVTAAEDISQLNTPEQITQACALPPMPKGVGYNIIEFPSAGQQIASPIKSDYSLFVGGGRTAGQIREFVIPNQPISKNWVIRHISGL